MRVAGGRSFVPFVMVLAAMAGCRADRLDVSSEDRATETLATLYSKASPGQRARLSEIVEQAQRDGRRSIDQALRSYSNMTLEEVIAAADAEAIAKKQQHQKRAKQRLNELENRLTAATEWERKEKVSAELVSYAPGVTVRARIHNNLDTVVSDICVSWRVVAPERALPILSGPPHGCLWFFLPGGLAPGEARIFDLTKAEDRLTLLRFELYFPKAADLDGADLQLLVANARDAGGSTLAGADPLSDEERRELTMLRRSASNQDGSER